MTKFRTLKFSMFVATVVLFAVPALAAETNTNRGGSDYRSFFLTQSDFLQCEQACAREAQCKAWTYVRPGIQGPNAKCWLKHSVPAATANNCCISGVAGNPTTGITDNKSRQSQNTTPPSKADPSSWKNAGCANSYRIYIHTTLGHVRGGRRTGVFVSGFDPYYKQYECFIAQTYGGVLEIEKKKRAELEHCRRRSALDYASCQVLGDWQYE
ncbi:MAG: PAN domain-containing protein [Hyphomicrobiales bacterium]